MCSPVHVRIFVARNASHTVQPINTDVMDNVTRGMLVALALLHVIGALLERCTCIAVNSLL